MTIAHVALPVAANRQFDYWIPSGLAVSRGAIVRVRLAARTLHGVATGFANSSEVAAERLQPVLERCDVPPLPEDVLALAEFVASYYQEAIGLAYALALPPLGEGGARRSELAPLAFTAAGRTSLAGSFGRARVAAQLYARLCERGLDQPALAGLGSRARRLLRDWLAKGFVERASLRDECRGPAVTLNGAQREAADAIDAADGFAAFLLQGVTGSGKSEVYFAAAARSIAEGKQALMLVPEINLTPQLEARVARALPGVRTATLHSGLPEALRRSNWLAAARGEAQLVLGTRLAVFAPLPNLALIVVDEEHDGSYKQRDGVRYHARDAAIWRARRRRVPIVLGSATPSLESYAAALTGRYRRIVLSERADPRARLPEVHFTPARAPDVREGIAAPLWRALGERVRRGEQALVFVNRRGYSPALKCAACQWEATCPRCSARLVVHRDPATMRCHHCDHREALPRACPDCGNVDLLPRGHGTQRLEHALAAHLGGARIARVDRDTTQRRRAFAEMRERVEQNEVDVLVGTQMLAKGHDFPRLTLVGVLGADNALYSGDFRATERLAALLMQVAGRAGRAALPGEVIVQTDFPGHPVFAALAAHDYDAFASALLEERRAAALPPFARLALLTAEAHGRAEVDRFLHEAHGMAGRLARGSEAEVFDPVPAPLARRAGFERAQMLLRAPRAAELQRVLAPLREALQAMGGRRVRWAIDVDPDSVA